MAIMESTSHQNDGRTNQSSHHSSHQINLDPEPIDFEECLKDSPKFRHTLKENLTFAEGLETLMSKAIKQVSDYIDTGRDHIRSQKDFINAMRNLNNALSQRESGISKRVSALLETLEEIMHLHEIVIDQSCRTVGSRLNNFINDDLLKIKEARKSFDKISHEYDQAVTKYSQPIKKQQDDSENLLIATSTAFAHTSLDLSIQLTSLQSKKGYEILDSLLSFTKAHSTFFHQGYDLFEDLKPHISDMDEFLSNIQDEFETLNRSLPSKHLMVSNNELRPINFDNKAHNVHLEGYLFKRASNGFKVWNRRWFILKDHQLLYQKRGDTQPTIMEEDLRLLTVRPIDKADNDRRFCFEVLSPQKSHILQADSEACCKTWISAIQAGINAAFHDTEHKFTSNHSNSTNTCAGSTSTVSSSSTANQSSWSSGFSFKTLHQHATNKLSSMTGESSGKEGSYNRNCTREKDAHLQRTNGSEEEDELDENGFKTDEQGRSYAPLREDDVDEDQPDGAKSRSKDSMNYPAPAVVDQASHNEKPIEPPTKPQRAYMKILAMSGNDECADCGAPQPKWASINLGITLCIECAGIHRSLGVHLSKVRSLTLDTEVWSPEIVQLMLSLGNKSVNAAYLSCLRGQTVPINSESSREDRESWIKDKYMSKLFMQPPEFKKIIKDDDNKKPQEESNSIPPASSQLDEVQIPSKCSSSETL